MKRLVITILVALSLVVLTACGAGANQGNDTSASEGFPSGEPVNLIVPYAAGGGTDMSARMLKPYLEEELGTSVVIQNYDGGGGWVGWSKLANAEPDGHTIGFLNIPNVIVGYSNPNTERKENLESYDFLINNVVDSGVIAIRADEDRFTNIQEFVEYAKQNKVTVNASGIGSSNHVVESQMNEQLGTKLETVHTGGTAEAIPEVLGGHMDVLVAGVAEIISPVENGELIPIGVFGSERVEALPEVPTLNETVGADINKMLSRPIGSPAGLDKDVRNKLQEAIEKATKNPEYIEEVQKTGMELDYTKGEELEENLKKREETIKSMSDILGW